MTDGTAAGEPFSIPGLPRGFVWPAGLSQRIERETNRTFVLIGAPAGSGKTAVLAAIAHSAPSDMVSWITLTRDMDHPRAFAAALVGSMHGVHRARLWNGDLPAEPHEVVRALINDAIRSDREVVLFLDRYEQIRHPGVHSLVTRLVEEAGANWRFRIGSRTVPPLSIARWRSQMLAAEVRFDDLCHGPTGVARLLRDLYGLHVRDAAAAQLADRTGGWVTGILLAGRQAQKVEDVDAWVNTFSGADASVVDYVSREIVGPLDATARQLVLQTVGLIRLCADLCAVVSRSAAPRTFHDLTTRETFLRPVLDSPGWFEHHPVLRDAFEALASPSPDDQLATYRRAREWCLTHGHVCDAVEYMMRGDPQDVADAAAVLSMHSSAVYEDCSEAQIFSWIDRMPVEMIAKRPALRLVATRSSLESGHLDAAAKHLSALESESDGIGDAVGFTTEWLANRIDLSLYGWNVDEALEQLNRSTHQVADAAARREADTSGHLAISAARVRWLAGSLSDAFVVLARIRAPQATLHTTAERHGLAALLAFVSGDILTAQSNVARMATLVEHIPMKMRARKAAYGCLAALWTEHTSTPAWAIDCAQPTAQNLPGDLMCVRALIRAELAWRAGDTPDAGAALAEASELAGRFASPTALDDLIRIQAQRFDETPPGPPRLSPAEQAVMELLPENLTNAQIAQRLFLSRNTVKTHLRLVYRKLGVGSKTDAIAKARQLGLLGSTDDS